eukprot:8808750-Ditylum_brightwellii.AAC.1
MPVSELEDKAFSGVKYDVNKNNSVFMHADLMPGTKENYYPEEHLLDPAVLRSSIAAVASTGVILVSIPEETCRNKCQQQYHNEDEVSLAEMSTTSNYNVYHLQQ